MIESKNHKNVFLLKEEPQERRHTTRNSSPDIPVFDIPSPVTSNNHSGHFFAFPFPATPPANLPKWPNPPVFTFEAGPPALPGSPGLEAPCSRLNLAKLAALFGLTPPIATLRPCGLLPTPAPAPRESENFSECSAWAWASSSA